MSITKHEVPLIKDDLDFLHTKVDNLSVQFHEIMELINTFDIASIASWVQVPIYLVHQPGNHCCRDRSRLEPPHTSISQHGPHIARRLDVREKQLSMPAEWRWTQQGLRTLQ